MTGSLDAAEVSRYRDDGFLRPVRVMEAAKAITLAADADHELSHER